MARDIKDPFGDDKDDEVELRPQPIVIEQGGLKEPELVFERGLTDPLGTIATPIEDLPTIKQPTFESAEVATWTPPPSIKLLAKIQTDPEFDFVDSTMEVASEVGSGIADGFTATLLRAEEGMNSYFSWLYSINLTEEGGNIPKTVQRMDRIAIQQDTIAKSMDARQQLDELVQNPDTPVLQRVSRDMTRFLIPYVTFTRVLGGTSFIARNLVAGPLADMYAFTTDEDRLSSLVVDLDIPGLSDATEKYLATDPDDTTAQAVYKQFIEGVILGTTTEVGLVALSKVWAGARAVRSKITGSDSGKVTSTEALPGSPATGSVLEEADSKAATVAQELLSQKIKIKLGDDPAEILTKQFRSRLQEAGIWDAFSEPDQAAKLLWFFRRAEKVFGPDGGLLPPPPKITQKAGAEWEDQWEFNVEKVRKFKAKQAKITPKKVLEALETSIVDRSGPFRRMLEKTPSGQRAAELFALARGASTKSALINKDAVRAIYQEKVPGLPIWKPVSREKRGFIDKAIMIRRFRQIKTYKPEWSEKGNPLSKQTPEFYDKRLEAMREELGEAKYLDVMKRADHFFSTMRVQLDELLTGGVISADEYKALSRFQFSPVKFIEELDKPIAQFTDPSGKPISVSSSGIQPLGKGAQRAIETDTEIFLQEVIVRSITKSMKNRANLALKEAAETDRLIGVKVGIPKGENSKDWTKITVMEDGKPKNMFLAREYAQMWAASPETMDAMWRTLGWASGAPLVRLGATGPLNPEFALSNFPRDMSYNILVSDQYSAFLPKAFKQWGEDFADVWQDAVFQKGAYKDYINEGGGMEFLTHQGIPGHAKPAHTVMKDWADAFAYTNTTSEVINRLATRNRTLKNIIKENGPDYILTQADKQHATFVARTVIDFDQGGTAAKALNEIFPYLNASVQGMRGYARSFKTNPVKASLYAAQLMGIYGGVNLASKAINPEAHAAVPDYVNSLYMTVTTPWSFQDGQGDTRYLYFKFPIDHSTVGLKVLADSLIRADQNQGLPNEKEVNGIKDTMEFLNAQFGIVPGANMPPVIQGAMALGANYDWWRQSPVWIGEQGIPPHMEFTEDTPEFFRDLGAISEGTAELSPARMEAAVRQVMPNNIFTNIMGAGYRQATAGIERDLLEPMEKTLVEKVREFAGARRFLGFTSPNGRFADHIRGASEQARGAQVQITRQVDAFSDRIVKGVQEITIDTATDWISQEVPFEMQTRAAERLLNGIALEKVFKSIKYDENKVHLPTRSWWKQVSGAPPAARAQLLVEHISAMQNIDGDKERKEAKQVIAAVMLHTPGFNSNESPEFAIGLKRELELHGIPSKDFFN